MPVPACTTLGFSWAALTTCPAELPTSAPSALARGALLLCLQDHPVTITWAKAAQHSPRDHPPSSEVKYSDQRKGWTSWNRFAAFSPAQLQGFPRGPPQDGHHATQKVRPGTALCLQTPCISSGTPEDHFCSYKIPWGQREDLRTRASREASYQQCHVASEIPSWIWVNSQELGCKMQNRSKIPVCRIWSSSLV